MQFIKNNNHINKEKSASYLRHAEIHVRSEVLVTMKNFIFWDIKIQFVPHRRNITYPLQSPAG
jgi:hypothetical protein